MDFFQTYTIQPAILNHEFLNDKIDQKNNFAKSYPCQVGIGLGQSNSLNQQIKHKIFLLVYDFQI